MFSRVKLSNFLLAQRYNQVTLLNFRFRKVLYYQNIFLLKLLNSFDLFSLHPGQGIQSVVQNSATNNGNVVMMVQPGGSQTNGTATGTVSPSIQRIPLPGKDIGLIK